MKLNDYQTQALQTALYHETIAKHLNLTDSKSLRTLAKHYALEGFIGEVGEYLQADDSEIIGELGGVMWYAAAVAYEFGCGLDRLAGFDTFEDLLARRNTDTVVYVTDICVPTLLLANQMKKNLRDNKPFSIREDVGNIFVTILVDAMNKNINLNEAARANLDKLASRAERGKIQGDGDNR